MNKKNVILINDDYLISECFSFHCLLNLQDRANWNILNEPALFHSLQYKNYRFFIIEVPNDDFSPYLLIAKNTLEMHSFVNKNNRGVRQLNKNLYSTIIKALTLRNILL